MIIQIGKKKIGQDQSCFIIAEAGVNHNGNYDLALKMVDVAVNAKVDAIKFQTFITEDLVTHQAPKANYQINSNNKDETFFELLKKLELPLAKLKDLKKYCESQGLIFLSTPFDFKSADFLDEIGIGAFKVSSTDFDDYPFLDHLLRKNKPLLISSGMADMAEVQETMGFFKTRQFSQLVLFQCTSSYPTPFEYVNLQVIQTYRDRFPEIIIGFSDHSPGTLLGAVAVGMGAKVIEKHFTLDKNLPGPDQNASLDPDQLREYVENIRITEKALGRSDKYLTPAEQEVKKVARKSIVSKEQLPKGTQLATINITVKRPGTGIPSKKYFEILGRKVKRDIPIDTVLQWSDLE